MTTIQATYRKEIDRAVESWSDHEGMSAAQVVGWLEQFEDSRIPLALSVIKKVKYLNAANIRGMAKQLIDIIRVELEDRGFNAIGFVPVGDAGSGSGTVARAIKDILRGRKYANCRLLSMLEVARLQGDCDALVFVDDFSGTGFTLEKWWENVEPTVRPANAEIFVGLLVLNESARGRIEGFAEAVLAVEELDESHNLFAGANKDFTEADKEHLLAQCQRTGCGVRYERGFGGCGLLLAFKHGCPNNSLPILWYESETWRALFKRRAI
ncbi:MAG TPA: hypothetical protein VKM72_31170 [Thermoanaerobaculia bacterium]|nr:hypothetical protein [Thermoanaerobaculia bacterium]